MAEEQKKDDDAPSEEERILEGLRKDYPDMADIPDDVFIQAVRETDFKDLDNKEFTQAIGEAYAPKSFAQKANQTIGDIGHELVNSFTDLPVAIGKGLGSIGSQKPREEMEKVGYQDLIKRGYSPEVAQNVMKQRIATQQEMAGQEQTTGEEGQRQTISGAANYGSLALGLGLDEFALKNLAAKGLLKSGVIKHALSGAGGFGSFNMIKAAAEGKGANEIMHEGLMGAGEGAIAGPLFAGAANIAASPFKEMAREVALNKMRYVYQMGTAEAGAQAARLAHQADDFAHRFNADWLRTRFSDMPEVTDPVSGLPSNTDPNLVAAQLIAKILGPDVAEHASEETVARMASKIADHRINMNNLDPSYRPKFGAPVDPVAMMQGIDPTSTAGQAGTPMTPRDALDFAIASTKKATGVEGNAPPMNVQGGQAPEPPIGSGSGAKTLGEDTVPGMQSPAETMMTPPATPTPLNMNTHPPFVPPDAVLSPDIQGNAPGSNPLPLQPGQNMPGGLPGMQKFPLFSPPTNATPVAEKEAVAPLNKAELDVIFKRGSKPFAPAVDVERLNKVRQNPEAAKYIDQLFETKRVK